jgi:8-amino-7-oxononanoate synthase
VRASLALIRSQPERRDALARLVAFAGEFGCTASGSQILPLIIGDDARTMRDCRRAPAARLRRARHPSADGANEGTARLRISLTLNVDEADRWPRWPTRWRP